jgi:hypothetical protein
VRIIAQEGHSGPAAIKFLAGSIKPTRPNAPYLSGMKRKTANIDIRVEPQLIERIDAWRAKQRVAPSRAAAIGYMLEHFLKHDRQEHPAGVPPTWLV